MNLSLILFLIGILGFVLNRKNIILMLISIEIMLLAITFLILVSSLSFDDILGQTFAIYVIAIAGAESAIGLGILVAFYRLHSSLVYVCLSCGQKICSNLENKVSSTSYYSYYTHSVPLRSNKRSYSTKAFDNHTQFSNTSQSSPAIVNDCGSNISITPFLDEKVKTIVLGLIGSKLAPWFITGLFDAESSFVVTLLKNSKYKTGWNVQARVQIKMHEKDRALIQAIQYFLGGIGYVSKPNKASTVEFRVSTLKDLVNVILPHFDKYPLKTKKRTDYLLFKQIVKLMLNEEHRTLEGTQKIINIRASLNTGLSEDLKKAFPKWKAVSCYARRDLLPAARKLTKNKKAFLNIDPDWLAGFATGESNLFIAVQKAKTNSGISTSLRFSVAQHTRDILLLESFIKYFGGGFVVSYTKRSVCEFVVAKIDLILNCIIPFFDKHPILGSKHLIYLDFKRAANIIKHKEHLNPNGVGLEEILQLKKRITSLYSEKAINNHSVEEGTDKSDQKR